MTWSAGDRTPAPHDERRWVSVLFVDLVGFTRRAGRLDPEDVRALQREYFGRASRAVRRWQGVVEKYVGDAVLAVFGALESDEYDAYRAVLAGLHVQRELAGLAWPDGTPVRARVGVATGEVIVDLAAVRDRGQALVCGDIVNTAARVQAHATPGTVVVTAATRGATGPWVRYAPLPSITPAGKPAPVDVWRALAPVPPAAPDPSVPLVGRAAEVSTVADRVTRALSERSPALVRVAGPAGVGKSRVARAALVAAGVRWWVGYGTPCGGRYAPLADLVRRQARVAEPSRPADVRCRMSAWAGGLVPADQLAPVLDGLSRLVVPVPAAPAPARRDPAVEAALLAVLRGAAARAPLALLLDDLHLADPATRAFVAELPERLGPLPVAVVATDRAPAEAPAVAQEPLGAAGAERLGRLPVAVVARDRAPAEAPAVALEPLGAAGVERLGRLPVAVVARDRALSEAPAVVLEPLGAADTDRLLRHLLERSGLPRHLAGRLAPLCGGIPGYAAEYARAVAAHGFPETGEPPLPPRVRGIASARLGRLDERDRAVLGAAAILGEPISAEAVAALLGADGGTVRAALARLGGLLVPRPGGEYAFADPAVRQVVYARLPRAVRAGHHWRAALRPGKPAARARHWRAASALARALPGKGWPCPAAAHAASLGEGSRQPARSGLVGADPAGARAGWLGTPG